MDSITLSTLTLIGGAVLLTVVALGPTIWRHFKGRKGRGRHGAN